MAQPDLTGSTLSRDSVDYKVGMTPHHLGWEHVSGVILNLMFSDVQVVFC